MEAEIKDRLRQFITDNYLFGDTSRLPQDDDSLLAKGVIDSTGILELIQFLEGTFHIEVAETETLPENLGSIAHLTSYIRRKGAAAGLGD